MMNIAMKLNLTNFSDIIYEVVIVVQRNKGTDSVILHIHMRDQSHGTNYEAVFPNLEIRDIPRL